MNNSGMRLRFYSAFLLSIIFSSCRNSSEELKPFTNKEDWLAEKAKKVQLFYSDSGMVRVEIKAPEMNRKWEQNEYKTTLPKGVLATFFDPQGAVSSTLTGNQATLDSKTGVMNVRGNVQVINIGGDTLLTESLTMEENSDLLHTDGPVTVRRKTQIISANGLESNRDFTKYSFTKVTGILTVQGKGFQ
jgi:LPS export ABC transporter protein LptC